jgi:hypothetical protein
MTARPIAQKGWTLTDKDGQPVMTGQTVTDFRGDATTIAGGDPPPGAGRSGYVTTGDGAYLYAHVFDLRWVSPEGRWFGDGKDA